MTLIVVLLSQSELPSERRTTAREVRLRGSFNDRLQSTVRFMRPGAVDPMIRARTVDLLVSGYDFCPALITPPPPLSDPRLWYFASPERRNDVRAMDSILQQTSLDLELIVVDDGSTDSTIHALQNQRDSRPPTRCTDQRGVVGRSHAKSDMIGMEVPCCTMSGPANPPRCVRVSTTRELTDRLSRTAVVEQSRENSSIGT